MREGCRLHVTETDTFSSDMLRPPPVCGSGLFSCYALPCQPFLIQVEEQVDHAFGVGAEAALGLQAVDILPGGPADGLDFLRLQRQGIGGTSARTR